MAGTEPEEERPLLASYRGRPDLDRQLRANLRTLRDRCEDEALRARFDDVLAGRSRLRDLATSADYQRFLGPLVLEGARMYEEAGRPPDPLPGDDAAPPAPMPGGTW
jgi:hypothetical protein